MEKEFIPYEQALALKELGFDESTYTWRQHGNGISGNVEGKRDYYNRKGDVYVALPLYTQAFRWFREKYNLHAEPYTADMGAIEYCFQIRDLYSEKYVYDNFVGAGSSYSGTFNTHEEAELACLAKLIEIVKEKK